MPCAEGKGCGGEGIVLPFEPGKTELDSMFGFTDVEQLPLSDEVLPVIFDGALITEEGLIDCFARHYPERAAFLLQLLSDQGPLGLGYRFEFIDDIALAAPLAAQLDQQLADFQRANLSADQAFATTRGQRMRGGGVDVSPGALARRQALENEYVRAGQQVESTRKAIGNAGNWRIDDDTKTIYAYTTINSNVDRIFLAEHVPFGSTGINPLPTNREGADWLYAVMGDWMARNGYPGAGSEEEFFRNWLTRNAAGTVLVGLGAAEMFGGVVATIGTGGLGAVGGVALTVVGFDTLSQGAKTVWTPNRHTSERGWIGDLVHATATRFGSEGAAQKFDRGWAVTQIVAGLGAPVVIRYAATRATRVAASGKNISPILSGQLDEARLAIAEVKGHRFGIGLVGDYAPLPSGRGAIMALGGVRRFLVPIFDSDIRVLLRLRSAQAGQVQERSRELGQGMAGFARGPIQNQGQAISFVHEVRRHMGLSVEDFRRLITRIEYGNVRSSRFATVDRRGTPVLKFRQNIGHPLDRPDKPYNELLAFTEVAHEINHALAYQRFISLGGKRDDFWRAFKYPNISSPYNRTPQYYAEEMSYSPEIGQ